MLPLLTADLQYIMYTINRILGHTSVIKKFGVYKKKIKIVNRECDDVIPFLLINIASIMKGIDDGEKIKIHLPELGGWKICMDLGNL